MLDMLKQISHFLPCFWMVILSMASASAFAQADSTSTNPIKIVIPFGPGSSNDAYARRLAQFLSTSFGTPVVVDNRPGANGILAAEQVARAKPDGTTFMLATNTTHAANPHLVSNLRYDPIRDFEPVSKMGILTLFMLVSSSSPFTTMESLIKEARQNPGTVTYGTSNSLSVLAGSRLGKITSTKMIPIPYKSPPQIVTDLVSGQISFAFVDLVTASPLLKAGKLRPLGVLADKRFPSFPSIRTLQESGLSDFPIQGWYALFAPAGTPRNAILRMNKAVNEFVGRPEQREWAAQFGLDIFGSTPEELMDYVSGQISLWGRLATEAGLKAE